MAEQQQKEELTAVAVALEPLIRNSTQHQRLLQNLRQNDLAPQDYKAKNRMQRYHSIGNGVESSYSKLPMPIVQHQKLQQQLQPLQSSSRTSKNRRQNSKKNTQTSTTTSINHFLEEYRLLNDIAILRSASNSKMKNKQIKNSSKTSQPVASSLSSEQNQTKKVRNSLSILPSIVANVTQQSKIQNSENNRTVVVIGRQSQSALSTTENRFKQPTKLLSSKKNTISDNRYQQEIRAETQHSQEDLVVVSDTEKQRAQSDSRESSPRPMKKKSLFSIPEEIKVVLLKDKHINATDGTQQDDSPGHRKYLNIFKQRKSSQEKRNGIVDKTSMSSLVEIDKNSRRQQFTNYVETPSQSKPAAANTRNDQILGKMVSHDRVYNGSSIGDDYKTAVAVNLSSKVKKLMAAQEFLVAQSKKQHNTVEQLKNEQKTDEIQDYQNQQLSNNDKINTATTARQKDSPVARAAARSRSSTAILQQHSTSSVQVAGINNKFVKEINKQRSKNTSSIRLEQLLNVENENYFDKNAPKIKYADKIQKRPLQNQNSVAKITTKSSMEQLGFDSPHHQLKKLQNRRNHRNLSQNNRESNQLTPYKSNLQQVSSRKNLQSSINSSINGKSIHKIQKNNDLAVQLAQMQAEAYEKSEAQAKAITESQVQMVYRGDHNSKHHFRDLQVVQDKDHHDRDMMVSPASIIFHCNQNGKFIKRAAKAHGWIKTTSQATVQRNNYCYKIIWDNLDSNHEVVKQLNNHNWFQNHFPDSRELTTKQGLNKNLHNMILPAGLDIFQFYPRCYDLSNQRELDLFVSDYNRTAILSCLKKHAKYFKSKCGDLLKEIEAKDIINQAANSCDLAKRQFKRSYIGKFPSAQHNIAKVNTILLRNAIFYAKNMLLQKQDCEGDEFIKRNFFKPTFKFNQDILDLVIDYSELSQPVHPEALDDRPNTNLQHLGGESLQALQLRGWEVPNLYVMYQTYKVHKELKSSKNQQLTQYGTIDGSENVWICKPSFTSSGFGIFCFNNLRDLFNNGSVKGLSPKIVQKYVERTYLIDSNALQSQKVKIKKQAAAEHRKFDLRQWVYVSSFDPLSVFIYKKAYLRICGSQFDLSQYQDQQRHISNHSVQKDKDLVLSSDDFIAYLHKMDFKKYGQITWENHFYPQIDRIMRLVFTQMAEVIENSVNSFELYGYDFVVDKDLKIWLIEVNMSPACAERQPWLIDMLNDMATGLVRMIQAKVDAHKNSLKVDQQDQNGHARLKLYNKLQMQYSLKAIQNTQWAPMNREHESYSYHYGSTEHLPQKVKIPSSQIALQLTNNHERQNLVIQGQALSNAQLSHERYIDKLCRRISAVQFIQKFYRGHRVRKFTKTSIYKKRIIKEKALQTIFQNLQNAQERAKNLNLLQDPFDLLKLIYMETCAEDIGQDKLLLNKVVTLQRAIRKWQGPVAADEIEQDRVRLPAIYSVYNQNQNYAKRLQEAQVNLVDQTQPSQPTFDQVTSSTKVEGLRTKFLPLHLLSNREHEPEEIQEKIQNEEIQVEEQIKPPQLPSKQHKMKQLRNLDPYLLLDYRAVGVELITTNSGLSQKETKKTSKKQKLIKNMVNQQKQLLYQKQEQQPRIIYGQKSTRQEKQSNTEEDNTEQELSPGSRHEDWQKRVKRQIQAAYLSTHLSSATIGSATKKQPKFIQ